MNRFAFLHPSSFILHPSLVSGLALTCSLNFPQLYGLPAYLALTPLLILVFQTRTSCFHAFLAGWITGLIGYGLLFSYVTMALSLPVFVAGLLYYAAYTGLFAAGVALCARRNIEYATLIAPFWWAFLEYIRGLGVFGVPAGTLGATQVRLLPLIQVVSVTGVYGLSFLIVAFNAAFARLWLARHAGWRPALQWTGAAVALLAGTLVYGFQQLSDPEPAAPALTVATVQADIDERGLDPTTVRRQIFEGYRTRTLALKDLRPAVIIFPETMTGSYLTADSLFLSFLAGLGSQTGSAFLIGSRHLIRDENTYQLYNSVFAISAEGRIVGRYDKNRLVPFGEYTPLGARFPYLAQFRISSAELTPGQQRHPLDLPGAVPAGIAICYEAMYAPDIRETALAGARLLAVISDDFWFKDTVESRQFFDEAILRAVENRLPVARCANMGVSGLIDAYGRVTHTPLTGVSGVTYGAMRLRSETSLYTRYGDVFAWACGVISLGGFLAAIWPARRGLHISA